MQKEEMIKKTALYDGIGVKVEDESGAIYYFYSFSDDDDAIDRAYRQNKGKKLSFYSQQKARKELFLSYMQEFRLACEEADRVDEQIVTKPYNEEAEASFKKAHDDVDNMLIVLCRRLMHWTGCTFASAKKQISTDSVVYSAFN